MVEENCSFTGEVFLGHLRYGTYGGNNITHCHPLLDKTTNQEIWFWPEILT